MVTTMQAKCSHKKLYLLYAIHVSSGKGEDEDDEGLRRYHVLQQFQDVFSKYFLELSPHKEVDSSIELILGETLVFKAPCRISTPELVELKLKLKGMLDKGHIRPSISPWAALVFLVKKK